MALKILNRDGSATTITDEEQRQIDDYAAGKSLAEIAAEPPRFAHLLKRKDRRPGLLRRFLDWLRPKPKAEPWPALARHQLEQYAQTFGVTANGTDADLYARIVARLREPLRPL